MDFGEIFASGLLGAGMSWAEGQAENNRKDEEQARLDGLTNLKKEWQIEEREFQARLQQNNREYQDKQQQGNRRYAEGVRTEERRYQEGLRREDKKERDALQLKKNEHDSSEAAQKKVLDAEKSIMKGYNDYVSGLGELNAESADPVEKWASENMSASWDIVLNDKVGRLKGQIDAAMKSDKTGKAAAELVNGLPPGMKQLGVALVKQGMGAGSGKGAAIPLLPGDDLMRGDRRTSGQGRLRRGGSDVRSATGTAAANRSLYSDFSGEDKLSSNWK